MIRYRYNLDNISITNCEEDKYIVAIHTGKIVKLNKIGGVIWDNIPLGDDNYITNAVFERFKEDREKIHLDVLEFLKALELEKIIIPI